MRNKRQKAALWVAVPALAGLALTGCGSQSAGAAVVATFQNGSVTQSQLDTWLHVMSLLNPQSNLNTKTAKTQILKEYITMDRLVAPLARKAGFKVDQTQVQQDVLTLKKQWIQQLYSGSAKNFNSRMQSLSITDANIAAIVSDNVLFSDYEASLVPQTAIRQYYDQNKTQFVKASQRGVLNKSKAVIERVRASLLQDHSAANWDKLAKQYSQNPGSKNNGGLYANQPVGQWVPQYQHAVLTQPIGRVGRPFDTTYGWFVVEVLNRSAVPLSQVKTAIAQQIVSNPSSPYTAKFQQVISSLEKKANIKIALS